MFDPSSPAFSPSALAAIHAGALGILERIGMRILDEDLLPPLVAAGASVDRATSVVRFPARLVEGTIEGLRAAIASGRRQVLLNGVICSRTPPGIQAKFGGAAIEFLDPLDGTVREPTEDDLIDLVRFGESIPEVTFVGNPVCYLKDAKGDRIPGPLQRILTAALVASHTTKYGSNEVWNEKELDLLIELGTIVRGGRAGYEAAPCFVTAKETIAPLVFPREDGKVLSMLAKRGLPCTVVPMPLAGATSPVPLASAVALGAAEILGVMTALRASHPDALVGGGVISGVMDMRTGAAGFAAPEALLQDVGLALLFERLYGQDFAIGTGYIDALLPGAQSAVEILSKISVAHATGRHNYPVGLLMGGKRWSPVQALIGLEMARYVHRFDMPVGVGPDEIPLALFEQVGIGGNFLGEDHTVERFRSDVWMPDLMERALTSPNEADRMVEKAKQIWSDFRKRPREPILDDDRLRAIEAWKRSAVRILSA